MPEIFLNYRTGYGDRTAIILDQELRRRFGDDHVFRDHRSIKGATDFRGALLNGIDGASCLVAVIAEGWQDAPGLRQANDWVRREIAMAIQAGIPVLPVLDGRKTDPLAARALPKDIQQIAFYQAVRFSGADVDAELARIGDELARLVPELNEVETVESQARSEEGAVQNSAGHISGSSLNARDIQNNGGTFVQSSSGPMHLGKGDQYAGNARHFSGEIGSYVEGDNHDGIHHHSGEPVRREGQHDGEAAR